MLPFTVKHYQRCFPGCKIVICDNESTDSSVKLAKELGCEVRTFSTNRQYNEYTQTDMKNTLWKEATTKWVIFCDMDEILLCNAAALEAEEAKGTTVLKTKAYEPLGKSADENLKDIDLTALPTGKRHEAYDKHVCFRKDKLNAINYVLGAHNAKPEGDVKESDGEYFLYHYKYIGLPYLLSRRKQQRGRATKKMRNMGAAAQFDFPDERIQKEFEEAHSKAEPIQTLQEFYKSRGI